MMMLSNIRKNIKRKSREGFTLVELLIVVVILGILAALILPRLTSQPERARVAEAMNELGAIRRAIQVSADAAGLGNAASTNDYCNAAAGALGNIIWGAIGITDPATGTADALFDYACTKGNIDNTNTFSSGTGDIVVMAHRLNFPVGNAAADGCFGLSVDSARWVPLIGTDVSGTSCGGTQVYQIINSQIALA